MSEEFTSPEEKLLRLIRGEKKIKDKPPAEKAVRYAEDGKVPAAAENRGAPSRAPQQRSSWNRIKIVNLTLIMILVVVAAVLTIDILSFRAHRESNLSVSKDKIEPVKPLEEATVAVPEAAVNNDVPVPDSLPERNLFKIPVAASPATPQVADGSSYERLKNFSLKGIIAGDKPQAIIEDSRSQKSYFLFKGESVNDIKVEDIQSDRVILKVNGEVLELTL